MVERVYMGVHAHIYHASTRTMINVTILYVWGCARTHIFPRFICYASRACVPATYTLQHELLPGP